MGYSTTFSLDLSFPGEPTLPEKCVNCSHKNSRNAKFCPKCGTPILPIDKQFVISEFRKEYEYAEYCLDENGDSNESGKWYDHLEEVRDFSKNYPDILFTLSGEGEEAGDIWKLYAKNRKTQEAMGQIIIEDFDERKLQ